MLTREVYVNMTSQSQQFKSELIPDKGRDQIWNVDYWLTPTIYFCISKKILTSVPI